MASTPRILIAEDDPMQGALLRAAMTERGYETVLVANGLDAVQRLRRERFDVALLDYHLPEVDGLAAARLMQDFEGAGHTRMIALTASTAQLEARRSGGGDATFHAVVSKINGLPAVMGAVDDHLAIAMRQRDAIEAGREREAAFHRARRRRRRMAAPLAAIPAVLVSAVFAIGLLQVAGGLPSVAAQKSAALHAATLRRDATEMVDAMADARLAEQDYLAAGTPELKERFYSRAERLDRAMSDRTSLRTNGAAGPGSDSPQAMVDPMLRRMADAVERRAPAAPEDDMGALRPLRGWAERLAGASTDALLRGLDAIRGNILVATGLLGFGIAYALLNAGNVFRRRWRDADADAAEVSMMAAAPSLHVPRENLIGPR